MQLLSFLIWDADPELFKVGFLQLRWYGLLFAFGFIISQQLLYYIHKKEGKPEEDVDTLTVFMVIATIVGARLGHVLFYEPDKYFADPLEILMIQKGGLASHGAAVGILIALWIYSNYKIQFKGFKLLKTKIKRPNQSYFQVLDRLVILIAMTAVLIRVGNFVNSEIEGKPTGSSTGVFFARNVTESLVNSRSGLNSVDYVKTENQAAEPGIQPIKLIAEFKKGYDEKDVRPYLEYTLKGTLVNDSYVKKHIYEQPGTPLNYTLVMDKGAWNAIIETNAIVRYPTQIIEAVGYLLVFIILFMIWVRYKIDLPEGRLFGLFLILLFGLRFLFEFLKENQVDFENTLPLNMGQLLSIPLIIAGVVVLIRSYKLKSS